MYRTSVILIVASACALQTGCCRCCIGPMFRPRPVIIGQPAPPVVVNQPPPPIQQPNPFKDMNKDVNKPFKDNNPFKAPVDNGRIAAGQGKVLLDQQGRLNPNDPQRENKPHKAFTVQFEQGKTYVITQRSTEMDSYLYVYDPQGLKVAEDDDSGGNLDSRVHVTANRTGNYTIACSVLVPFALPQQGANFTINVRER